MILPLTITRSPRRKRTVALKVEADGSLSVLAPLRTSVKWIESFVASRRQWIKTRQAALIRDLGKRNAPLRADTLVPFRGEIKPVCAFCPATANMTRTDEIRTELTLWYKKQARKEVQTRAKYWAEKTGLSPRGVIVTSPRRRWGSCNAKNEIRLSWRLIMAHPDLLDYVIVHELAHIAHKNHSPHFWACVADFIPDWKNRRAALRLWEKEAIHHIMA